MPGLQIEDPRSGRPSYVDDTNRLMVRSVVDTVEHEKAHEGLNFIANTTNTADSLTVTATKGQMLYLENTSSDRHIGLTKLKVSSNTAGVLVTIQRNPTVGTIGANNTHTPVNTNLTSGVAAEVTAYNWNETGTGMTGITAGTTFESFILGVGVTTIDLATSFILFKGDRVSITAKAPSGTLEFACNLHFYFTEEGP